MSFHVGARRAINSVFATFGVQGVYTPQGGTPLNVTVIKRQPDEVIDVLDTRIHTPTAYFLMKQSDVPSPKTGDVLEIDGLNYAIQGEPVQDQHHLCWQLEAPLTEEE